MQNVNSIKPLTSIRFLAAFYVLLFHCDIRWSIPIIPGFIKNVLAMGPMAMSLFFILSGFILYYNYDKMDIKTDYMSFLLKRFARIYPIYICAAILTLPFITLAVNPSYEHILLNHVVLKYVLHLFQIVFLAIANLFVLQGWFPGLFSYWNDGGSWSLSVEVLCYILFPFFIILFKNLQINLLKYLIVGLYILSILPGLAYLLFYPQPLLTTIYSLPVFRLPEFLIGVILGIFLKKKMFAHINYQYLLLSIIIIWVFYSGLIGDKAEGYVTSNFIIIPTCSILIYGFANLKKGILFKLSTSKIAVILGESSYCLYLLQALPIQVFEKFGNNLATVIPLVNNNYFKWGFTIMFSIAISILFHYKVERVWREKILNKYHLRFKYLE